MDVTGSAIGRRLLEYAVGQRPSSGTSMQLGMGHIIGHTETDADWNEAGYSHSPSRFGERR